MGFFEKVLDDLHPNNLRYLFYLVTPNETFYENIDDIPNYTNKVSLWFIVLLMLEYAMILLRGKGAFALNDTITSINAGTLSLMFKFGGRYLSVHVYTRLYERVHLINLPAFSVWTWLLCFFSQDLMYYLGHRCIHEFGVFWSFHQTHHSSEYYNLSTALRQGAIQDLATGLFDCLQSWIIPPNVFLVHRYLEHLYQFWLHTEQIPYLGPFEYFFNTPSSHRVHHGRNPYCIDKNYGGTLIIWDRLFGTYEAERTDEKVIYGLVDNIKTFNQLWLQSFEFKALGWDKGHMRDKDGKETFPGFWYKVRAALYPPGWFPGTRVKRFFFWWRMENTEEGIPQIEEKVMVYNPPLSQPVKCYVFFQWMVTLLTALYFNKERLSLPWSTCILLLLFIIVSMQSIGYFLDKSKIAVSFEITRLMGVLLFCIGTWRPLFLALAVVSLPILHYIASDPKRIA